VTVSAQCMAALEKARVVKGEQVAIRRALRAAELSLPAALADPRAQRMTIDRVLQAQYGWGLERAWVTLQKAGRLLWPDALDPQPVPPGKLVGELTDRERAAIMQACGGAS
jgi:hypothetical protein